MSYLSDEPTNKIPAIEPTQRANPYEMDSPYPYYGTLPDIPPPPPRERKGHTFLWVLFAALFVVLIVSTSFFGVQLYGHQTRSINRTVLTSIPANPTATIKPTPQPTLKSESKIIPTPTPQPPTPTPQPPTPTPQPTIIIATPTPQPPTPTPIPTVPYYASDIYNDFYASGLGGPNPHSVTWGCCTYNPAGGIQQWTDSKSGIWMQLATFYNNSDAEVDAGELYQQGYYYNVASSCLLLYPKTFPTSILSEYVQVMQSYCN
jgi:hypothetical protein